MGTYIDASELGHQINNNKYNNTVDEAGGLQTGVNPVKPAATDDRQ